MTFGCKEVLGVLVRVMVGRMGYVGEAGVPGALWATRAQTA